MWKSIGSLATSNLKGKDERVYEPFAQASRLKLNQSQLSGASSPQFMNQYFSKKRLPQALHRSQSQKSLQLHGLREADSLQLRSFATSQSNKQESSDSILSIYKEILNDSLNGRLEEKDKMEEQVYSQLKQLKRSHLLLKKDLMSELNVLRNQMKSTEQQVHLHFDKIVSEEDVKKERSSLQILIKVKQENLQFSLKMKEIEVRKQKLKEKYRMKDEILLGS